MGITAEQRRIVAALRAVLPDDRRLPHSLRRAAELTGFTVREIRSALTALGRAGELDRELDRQIVLQSALDDRYCRPRHLVCAPLLTAEEIRRGDFMPQTSGDRPYVTLTMPREYARGGTRLCAFIVTDDVMEPLHILRGDAAVCAIGLPPRNGAPTLCVLPSSKEVCVRCCFTDAMFPTLAAPDRRHSEYCIVDPHHTTLIGPVISVQRFQITWRRPYRGEA